MGTTNKREAWNKGKLVGQKSPLKPKDTWAIRVYLQNEHAVCDLAMFNLVIGSKLRGRDLVSLRVRDVTHGTQALSRAMVVQRKTQGRCSSSRQSQRERRCRPGPNDLICDGISFCSRAERRLMYRHANTRGLCITGPSMPVCTHRPMGRLPCGEPRPL